MIAQACQTAGNSLISQLETELRPKIWKILKHPFLTKMSEGKLALHQVRQFALQYDLYCAYFPRFLAAVAANVPDDPTRVCLVRNLWEEHGEGDLQHSHRTLFNRFLCSLGISENRRKATHPFASTRKYVEATLELCSSRNYLQGIGALSVGAESFTAEEYELILTGLHKYQFLTESDLEFWSIHLEVDDNHYAMMLASLISCIHSEEELNLVELGALQAVELEISFWDGLYSSICG